MQIKTITVRYGRTQSLESYCNVRPEITISADLEEGDNPEAAKAALLAEARAFVEESVDQALEADGLAAKFDKGPRYRLAYTAEEIYAGSGWTQGRQQKATAPERLLVLTPVALNLQGDGNPGRRWWGEPFGPSRKLRLAHARSAAVEWLADHEGYRLIDCADGDLSRIPAWALEAPAAPEPEPTIVLAEDDLGEDIP